MTLRSTRLNFITNDIVNQSLKTPYFKGFRKRYRGSFKDEVLNLLLQKKSNLFQIAFQIYRLFRFYSTVMLPKVVVSPFTTATSSTVTVVITSATSSASIVRS